MLLLFGFSSFSKQIQLTQLSANISAYLIEEKSSRSFRGGDKNDIKELSSCFFGGVAVQLRSTQLWFPTV